MCTLKAVPDDAADAADAEQVVAKLQLAGEADRVRTEVPLSEVPAGSVIVQVDCVDNTSVQERRGIGFGITDDGRVCG